VQRGAQAAGRASVASMADTMRAVVARGGRTLQLELVVIPEPGPGEVRVRVGACGICGSDLHLRHLGVIQEGLTPGHEIAGRVDTLGAGVTGFAPGDAVVVEPLASCGLCAACRSGREATCPSVKLFGVHANGGMAEQVVVPAARLFRVDPALDARVAALAEPLAVVVHGLRRGGFEAGQRVLVLGAGNIGLLAAMAARAWGAGEVAISARHPHQAELARRMGATRVLREEEATPKALAAAAQRDGGAELVIETVGGQADTLRAAGAAIAPGGTISVLGLFLGPVSLDGFGLFTREGTVAFSNCYARSPRADFADAVALLEAERERLAPLVTHTVPFSDPERAFALAEDKRAGAIKVSLVP